MIFASSYPRDTSSFRHRQLDNRFNERTENAIAKRLPSRHAELWSPHAVSHTHNFFKTLSSIFFSGRNWISVRQTSRKAICCPGRKGSAKCLYVSGEYWCQSWIVRVVLCFLICNAFTNLLFFVLKSPRKTVSTAQTLYHRFHLFFPRKDFNFHVCVLFSQMLCKYVWFLRIVYPRM